MSPVLAPKRLGNYEFLLNPEINIYPYFSIELRQRVKKKKATNVIVTGEGGVSKTYTVNDICRILSPRHFDVDCVVFTYQEFMYELLAGLMGVPIDFDEPSYAMGKRTWYDELQKALVTTLESFRFKVRPLFIPIINQNLLDKSIRSYLIQYHVVMLDRGRGTVYRRFADQFRDKVYRYQLCEIRYGLGDLNLCDIPSCLDCKKLDPENPEDRCMIFRAQYERKKATKQESRYEQALADANRRETKNLTIQEIEAKAIKHFEKFYDSEKDKVDVNRLAVVLDREENIKNLGHNKLYRLKAYIELDRPDLFKNPDETLIAEVKQ